MNTLQPTNSLGLVVDVFSMLDEAECNDLARLLERVPMQANGLQPAVQLKKVWLANMAWIALCLVIFTGALLFALHMLAR